MKNELKIRLQNESPSFFKKIQAIGITLGSVGLAIVAIPSSVIILPTIVTTIAGYFIAIGYVSAAIAKTTVADPSVLKTEQKEIQEQIASQNPAKTDNPSL